MACVQLATCCSAIADQSVALNCLLIVQGNDGPTCQQSLAAYRSGGLCP
jgi:hypothetical protein